MTHVVVMSQKMGLNFSKSLDPEWKPYSASSPIAFLRRLMGLMLVTVHQRTNERTRSRRIGLGQFRLIGIKKNVIFCHFLMKT